MEQKSTNGMLTPNAGQNAQPVSSAPLRVCIIYAYPSLTSGHGPKILQKVLDTLREAAVEYDVLDLYRERFNPVMSEEEIKKTDMGAWPDVVGHQSKLMGASSWIFLYPVWWSATPAMLKGWTDRVLSSGFAYKNEGKKMVPLLGNKRALIVRTFGGPASYEEKLGHVAQASMDKAVLGACGVKSVAVDIYSVEELAETAFAHALFQVQGAVRRVQVKPSMVPHHLRSISAPYLPPIEQKPRLPVDNEGEEKIELSEEAKSDLEYFKSARRKAREGVHQRADARQSGKPQNRSSAPQGRSSTRNESRPSTGGNSGFARGGDRFFGRKREGRPNAGGYNSSEGDSGIFGSGRSNGPNRSMPSGPRPQAPRTGSFNQGPARPGQARGGGSFSGRPAQGGRQPKPKWTGGDQRRRRH